MLVRLDQQHGHGLFDRLRTVQRRFLSHTAFEGHSLLEDVLLAVVVINAVRQEIRLADLSGIDSTDHAFQLFTLKGSIVADEEYLMDGGREDEEVPAELFSGFLQEAGDLGDGSAVHTAFHRRHPHGRFGHIHHAAGHLCHDLRHVFQDRGMVGDLSFQRVSVQLPRGNPVFGEKLVRDQRSCSPIGRARNLHPVNDSDILDGLVWNAFQHLFVGLDWDNLHGQMVFYRLIIRDGRNFKGRDCRRNLFGVGSDLIEDRILLRFVRLITVISRIQVERDCCRSVLRPDGDPDVGFTLELIDSLNLYIRFDHKFLDTVPCRFQEFIKVHHRGTPPSCSSAECSAPLQCLRRRSA